MKRMFMVVLLVVLVPVIDAAAQITISTNTFNPPAGTQLVFKGDPAANSTTYTSFSSGSGGPMVWDFSTRTFSTGLIEKIASLAATPRTDSFPGATFSIFIVSGVDTTWLVQKSTSALYESMGTVSHASGTESAIVYKNLAPDWVFPIALNSTWTAHRTWTQVSGKFHTDVLDTTVYTADAWGTAKYQTKSVSCLRVMAHDRITDNTYDSTNTLIYTAATEITTAYFVANGFNSLVSVSHSSSSGIDNYSTYASQDFLNLPTDVRDNHDGALPQSFALEQNYPNPFNPRTEISFNLPKSSSVKLSVFNVQGEEVKVLINRPMPAGSYTADWDGTNQAGSQVASGVYFYRMEAAGLAETRKMVLLK